MQDTMTAARVVVTSEAYPSSLRPSGSSASAFWTGDEEDRTFFAVETTEGDRHLVLVLGQDDSRSLYMRGPESMDENERAALEAAGLDPFGHKVWTIDREHVAFADEQVPMLTLGVGEPVSDEVLRNLRGVLFRRFGKEGSLWVTHGDGTATQIVGDPIDPDGRRMGVGKRHETYVPDNCWVNDGWTYAGFDTKRVPADPGTEPKIEPGDWFTWGSRIEWFRLDHLDSEGKHFANGKVEPSEGDAATVKPTEESFHLASMVEDGGYDFFKPTSPGLHPVIQRLVNHEAKIAEADALTITIEGETLSAVDLAVRYEATKTEAERLQVRLNSVEDALRREQERLRESQSRHASDIEMIGDRLIEECETRSWCEEYDKVVSDLNSSLNIPLREREREFEVTIDVTVRITKTVEAVNADEAGRIAEEGVSSYDLEGADIHDTDVYEVDES